MPQNAFHSLIGAAVGRRLWPGRVPIVLGFVLGSMIPDVDVLPLAALRLAGHWGTNVHRTLTHSIFFVALWLAAAAVARPRSRDAAAFLCAAGAGVAVHIGLDLLFWFSGVNLLWPLSEWMGWRQVNLWRGVELPAVAGNADFIANQLAALDAAAFALYLGYLSAIARRSGVTNMPVWAARAVGLLAAGLFPVYVGTGMFLTEWQQSVAVYSMIIVVFFPTAFITTIALRGALAGLTPSAAPRSTGPSRSSSPPPR